MIVLLFFLFWSGPAHGELTREDREALETATAPSPLDQSFGGPEFFDEHPQNNPLVQKIMANPLNKNIGLPPLGAIVDIECFIRRHGDDDFLSSPATKPAFKKRCNQFKVESDSPIVKGQQFTPYFRLRDKTHVMIVDYTMNPQNPRAWLINTVTGVVETPFAAAQGRFKASPTNILQGPEMGSLVAPLQEDDFGNVDNTNASAHGFLIAGHEYTSSNPDVGDAMVFHGVEWGINDHACRRGTVVHAKEGVSCFSANALTSGCIGVCKDILPHTISTLKGAGTDKSGDHSTGGLIYVLSPAEKSVLGSNCGRNLNIAPKVPASPRRPSH